MRMGRKIKKDLSLKIYLSQKNCLSPKKVRSDFFIPRARLVITKLRQTFVKALILYHFDSERYIGIETNASGYAIGGVFSQLTLDNLGQ